MIASLTGKKQSKKTIGRRKKSLERYYKKHPDYLKAKIANLHKKYTDKIRGTGWRLFRETYLKKHPNCKICGITREEHKKKYGKDIAIHHIDNKGTALKSLVDMNNQKSNLMTLCMACHQKLHKPAKK